MQRTCWWAGRRGDGETGRRGDRRMMDNLVPTVKQSVVSCPTSAATHRIPQPNGLGGSWPSGCCSPRRARPGGNWRRNRPLAGLPNRRHFGRDRRCPARRSGPVAPCSRRKGRARGDHRNTVRGRRDDGGGGRVVLWHPDRHIPTHCLRPTIHLRHKVSWA